MPCICFTRYLAHSRFLTVSKGAKALIPESHFAEAKEGTTYVAPQVLIDVDHSMKVMSEETFGPVFGIMKVSRLALGLRSALES